MKIAIIIGAFQTPNISSEQFKLIRDIIISNDKVVVLLLDTKITNQKWPLSYEVRREMILNAFEHKILDIPLPDTELDVDWSLLIDSRIDLVKTDQDSLSVRISKELYDRYTGKYKGNISASFNLFTSRHPFPYNPTMTPNEEERLWAYRCGRMDAYKREYGYVYSTVDIAVITSTKLQSPLVLLGRKKNESFFRFPGGFVDPKDDSRETAARRELYEETKLSIESQPTFLGDFKINDWRYKNTQDSIMTSFYKVDYSFGIPVAADDLSEVKWFSIQEAEECIGEAHKILLTRLKKTL